MSVQALPGLWAESLAVSVLIWIVLLIVVLYAGRRWIEPFGIALYRGVDRLLRFSQRALRATGRHVELRQRAYLRSTERERLDHRLHRELRALHDRVNRDLGGYPVLQRAMHQQIQRLEQDYHAAEDMPPAEPPWLRTVADLSRNPPNGDPAVSRILEDIHDGLQRAARAAQDEYHAASRKRLELLRDMLPAWRNLTERLNAVEHAIQGVVSRSRQVDEALARHEALRESAPEMDAGLTAGAFGRMLISGALLVIAALAALVSFYLIERPMAGALDVAGRLGPWPLSGLAAGMLVLLAVAAGVLMTESRRITSLIPGVGTAERSARRWLFAAGLLLLLVVAVLQGVLAFSREIFMARDEVLTMMMTLEAEVLMPVVQWTPMAVQAAMAVILAPVVALTAIPLESFLRHGRIVLGAVFVLVLRLAGFLLAVLMRIVRWVASLMSILYGLLIFVPDRIEQLVRQRVNGREAVLK